VFEDLLTKKVKVQMTKINLLVMKRLKERTHLHRYVVKEIYKYVDG
jgi:hypothetical protein